MVMSQTPRRSSSASVEHCHSSSLNGYNLPATWQEGKRNDSNRLLAIGDATLFSAARHLECCYIPFLHKNSSPATHCGHGALPSVSDSLAVE
ncbi:hypothetical protein OPV22_009392 [Ensete ventricosum]|uniref:Uncharacterized protein n=1 Tax=Ensete ventricosum TaxID=4639 RepID=A0AAV8RAW8_ENSVE|nr:hypothetical protein OPV22_009392 [Ensete ventricosum]